MSYKFLPFSPFSQKSRLPSLSPRIVPSLFVYAFLHIAISDAAAQAISISPAAVSPSQAAEEGLRRQEERVREQLQKQQIVPSVLRPDDAGVALSDSPVETPCFDIHSIQFDGEYARRFSWLKQEAEPYLNRCIGVKGLQNLTSVLDAKLIELGYATSRLSLPPQNLANGVLTYKLHTGKVEGVRMTQAGTQGAADQTWGTWWNAVPTGEGDILNIRDLEQGVEQMQRLPSQLIQTRIEPGSTADTSVVVIERQVGGWDERIRGGITLDNSGSEPLGRTQLASYLSLDNPLGINDILSLSANSNAENPGKERRSYGWSINYSVPVGYSTLSFTKSRSRFAQIVQGTTVRFLSSGESESDEARLHHVLIRTASSKFGIYAALSSRRANSFLDDVELLVQRRRTTNFEVGSTFKRLIGNAVIDAEIGYRRGVPWRDAQEDFPIQSGLTLRPKIWTASIGYDRPFKLASRAFRHSAALRAQLTNDATLSVDQIAIGSRYSVRGFDGDSVLLAEKGFYLRNEIATALSLVDDINSQFYVGIDIGRVWGPSDINLIGNKLAGAVIGLRGQWRALQFDLALGTPLYKPSGFRTRHVNPYVAATYAF